MFLAHTATDMAMARVVTRASFNMATPSLSPTFFKPSSLPMLTSASGFPLNRSRVSLGPCHSSHSSYQFVSSNCVVSFRVFAPSSSISRCKFPTSVSSSSSSSVSVDSPPPAEAADVGADLNLLDIRVGKIVKAWKHPEADSLYVEEVDVGEPEGPRTICSGLVKYVAEEELQGRTVVVFANLKPRNMRGVKSNGMLLCASDAPHEKVELLSPPEGAAPGERIWFGSEDDQANQTAAGTPNQVQKKKIWESIQPLLKTTEDCAAVFQDRPMRVSTGIVTCATLKGGNIS